MLIILSKTTKKVYTIEILRLLFFISWPQGELLRLFGLTGAASWKRPMIGQALTPKSGGL